MIINLATVLFGFLFVVQLAVTTSTTTSEVTTTCPNQLPGGDTCPPGPPVYYADPEECSNFWLCVGGCAFNEKVTSFVFEESL